MASIERGAFEVVNPYSRKTSRVPATPDKVHSIVFWSKDFGAFLNDGFGDRLYRMGFRFFFNFTINSADSVLEPRVPPLTERLAQLAALCSCYGPDSVQWRFDPICHMVQPDGGITDNLADISIIARHAAATGVTTCVTSFVDLYRKVHRRLRNSPGIEFIDPPPEQKAAVVVKLEKQLSKLNIALSLCCESEVIDHLPADTTVRAAACIPSERLVSLYGPGISMGRDNGQRRAAGCGCGISKDIGSYHLHPCHHHCLFCYANPSCDRQTDR